MRERLRAGTSLEITLFGPGYGESVVLHVGNGAWIVVDSCIDKENTPVAIQYLNRLGVDPAEAVTLVVATHWHDDHIRGMARLVAACTNARFCCAGVLCREEFLEVVGALEAHSFFRCRFRTSGDSRRLLGARALDNVSDARSRQPADPCLRRL